jgi:hypothetical protein
MSPRYFLTYLALPITIYNIVAEIFTVFLPIACIYAANSFKYFNTVLVYCVIIIVAKIIQIVVLILFNHSGTCSLAPIERFPLAAYSSIELACLIISTWVLRRIKRVDRESKAVSIIKQK